MSDLISRSDAIEALCHNCAYYTDAQCKTDSGYWCESGAMIREDIPSAEFPNGDLISRADAIEAVESLPNTPNGFSDTYSKSCIIEILEELPSAEAEQTDCTDFINWLTEEVMDDEMWELNAVANGEIICRKLVKLGVLEVTEEPSYYIRPSTEPKWNCTANFVAEQLERLRNMTDEERLKLLQTMFPSKGGDDE